ncbi:MAG: ribulose-phosphate 3-epimerase [Phycisphaerae bacterium]|nr:ribulose-phosphate 3-epimerase [Phycisphaerae bacterium]
MRKLPPTGTIEIAPSILSADFNTLGDHIQNVAASINILHLDIMDGHFVPNISFGPVIIKKIRPHFDLFFDAHLMITDPRKYAPEFAKAGADGITFHIEAVDDPKEMIKILRDLGVSVGISLKPKTPVETLEPIIADVDMVLQMTVEPGFGGQKFMADSPQRCQAIRKMLRNDQRLQVDGGIHTKTAPIITQAGADTLVAGSAIFGQPDPAAEIAALIKNCLK